MNGLRLMGSLILLAGLTLVAPFSLRGAHAEDVVKANVFGRVTLADNSGLSGVSLYLGDSSKVYARTNSEGRYTISNLPVKTYVVKALLNGYKFTPETRSVTLPTKGKPTSPNAEANFRAVQRTDLAITGLIRTSDNKPLAKVSVTLSGEGIKVRTVSSNADGIYDFEKLPYGTYTVTPALSGYTFDPTKRSVRIPTTSGEFAPNGRANFLAKPVVVPVKARIFGHVFDASGAAVSGVGIFLNDATAAATKTGTDGKYAILNLGKGRYVVTPKKDGLTFDPATRIVELPTTGKPSSPDAEANFVASVPAPKYLIRGRVTNKAGVALQSVEISIAGKVLATTNAEGRYAIEGLKAGTYTVTPARDHFVFTPTSVAVTLPTTSGGALPNAEVNFSGQEVAQTYSIRGLIRTSAGLGVPETTITLGDGDHVYATTDRDGYYYIGGLIAGTYNVHPHYSGATFAPASAAVTVPVTEGVEAPNATRDFIVTFTK